MKKHFIKYALIWLCVLAVLWIVDVAVLQNLCVTTKADVKFAPSRLFAPTIGLAKTVPEEGALADLERILGVPDDVMRYNNGSTRGFYDLQLGGLATFRLREDGESYYDFKVEHTRLGTGRWLILPGIMLTVAIAEVVIYKLWKKKKARSVYDAE